MLTDGFQVGVGGGVQESRGYPRLEEEGFPVERGKDGEQQGTSRSSRGGEGEGRRAKEV